VQVAAGTNHTVVTCNRGVYSFGCNDHGQLGLGSLQDAPVPVRVKQLAANRDKIVQVAAGLAHTLFISESNRVYAAGLCDLGQFKPAPSPSPLAGASGSSGSSAGSAAVASASAQPGTSTCPTETMCFHCHISHLSHCEVHIGPVEQQPTLHASVPFWFRYPKHPCSDICSWWDLPCCASARASALHDRAAR
jgi:alpha-tubulin suppressor-like RCC1 family protein